MSYAMYKIISKINPRLQYIILTQTSIGNPNIISIEQPFTTMICINRFNQSWTGRITFCVTSLSALPTLKVN